MIILTNLFRFLRNLLFLHGHENLRRNAVHVYHTVYKNVMFGVADWFFGFFSVRLGRESDFLDIECFFSLCLIACFYNYCPILHRPICQGFSAIDLYNTWLKQIYNLAFTPFPPVLFSVFDRMLPADIFLTCPWLYPIALSTRMIHHKM